MKAHKKGAKKEYLWVMKSAMKWGCRMVVLTELAPLLVDLLEYSMAALTQREY